MTPPREEEYLARFAVSRALGVTVDAYDDGSEPSMPDALIRAATGDEPLEVVTDTDSPYLKLRDALKKHGRKLDTEPGSPAWEVTLIHTKADLRRVRLLLPQLIRKYESELLADHVPEELEHLGVEDAHALPGQRGFIHFSAAGWNSWDYISEFGDWLDGVFRREADVAQKLARYGGTRQHAFVWVTSLASWSALDQLEVDEENIPQLPNREPDVPDTLTDIWISSTLVRPSRGMLHWHRGRGWSWAPLELSEAI